MKVMVDTVSCNAIKYINALQRVDEKAKYVDGSYGGYVLMDINDLSQLAEIIHWVDEIILKPKRVVDGIEVMPIEIYDGYRE